MGAIDHRPEGADYSLKELIKGLDLEVGLRSSAAQRAVAPSAVKDVTAKPQVIPEGNRNTALLSLAGSLRRRGVDSETILSVLLTQNASLCKPPLPTDEVERIAASVARYEPQVGGNTSIALTDTANAERFEHDWKEQVRFIPEWKKWLIWDGTRWVKDDAAKIMELAKESARRIYEEGVGLTDEKLRIELAKHGSKSLHLQRLKAMIELAQSIPSLVVHASQLDSDPMLLGVKNGVIDLRTGKLRMAKREDLMTNQAPVEFDPKAKCPVFLKFLDDIMGGKASLVGYMQRVMGYGFTGLTTEQCLFFCHGLGANGKSTLLNVMKDLLGEDYCKQSASETLMASWNGKSSTNDLARLRGARVVLSNEVEEGSRLSESLIKQMTGGDPISARFLYGEFFDFVPQFKLLIAGNHQPVIRGDDTGIWRRLQLVPFTVTIPPEKRDADLASKLHAELPGILNFALKGCLDWQKNRLQTPPEVVNAVKEYRADMDVLGQWIAECCDTGPALELIAGFGYDDYKVWAERNGFHQMTSNAFGRRLKERGYDKRHSNKANVYLGIALRTVH